MDGVNPNGVILSGNTLYGTAQTGGSAANGTVFRVNMNGTDFTNLHNFTGTSGPFAPNNDGSYPQAALVLSGNTLYGTARSGGTNGNGTVFRVNTDGTGFTNLHSFTVTVFHAGVGSTNSDGANPFGGLILSGNILYGTTTDGGAGAGNIFAINTDGTGFRTVHNFTINDGYGPAVTLLLSGNILYGTAENGGNNGNGGGTVFRVNTDGSHFTRLYGFTGGSDGYTPIGVLVLSGTTLYGAAYNGGAVGLGTIYAMQTNGMSFTNLYSFTGGSDGANPSGTMVLAGNILYGTAISGGTPGHGTVFSLHTDGTAFSTLYGFTGGSDGGAPFAGLILAGNALYGTTGAGGTSGNGTVFSLLPGAGAPKLTIMRSGTNAILTWSATGYVLQSTTNLASPVWIIVTGQNSVTNPISGTKKFYRLSQ
jgi:uncharacterized repeat protein (TIGR03803 family)